MHISIPLHRTESQKYVGLCIKMEDTSHNKARHNDKVTHTTCLQIYTAMLFYHLCYSKYSIKSLSKIGFTIRCAGAFNIHKLICKIVVKLCYLSICKWSKFVFAFFFFLLLIVLDVLFLFKILTWNLVSTLSNVFSYTIERKLIFTKLSLITLLHLTDIIIKVFPQNGQVKQQAFKSHDVRKDKWFCVCYLWFWKWQNCCVYKHYTKHNKSEVIRRN